MASMRGIIGVIGAHSELSTEATTECDYLVLGCETKRVFSPRTYLQYACGTKAFDKLWEGVIEILSH